MSKGPRISVTRDGISANINPDDLEAWIAEGWKKGAAVPAHARDRAPILKPDDGPGNDDLAKLTVAQLRGVIIKETLEVSTAGLNKAELVAAISEARAAE